MTAPRLIATSALSRAERDTISELLDGDPLPDLYWRCSLDDLARGLDNRSYLIGRRRRGVILGIHFHEVSVFSTAGELDDDELASMLASVERIELHVRDHEMERLRGRCADRLTRVDGIRYYLLESETRAASPPACRAVRKEDVADVLAFFRAHYADTVLSPWMFDLPFVGIWEDGALVAVAGTIALSEPMRACLVGHFLTHPSHRGRGLARTTARGLLHLLGARGLTKFMLGVNEENRAAWRVYEDVGFRQIAARENAFLGRSKP